MCITCSLADLAYNWMNELLYIFEDKIHCGFQNVLPSTRTNTDHLLATFVSDNKKVFGGFELYYIAHASKLLVAFVSDNNVRF